METEEKFRFSYPLYALMLNASKHQEAEEEVVTFDDIAAMHYGGLQAVAVWRSPEAVEAYRTAWGKQGYKVFAIQNRSVLAITGTTPAP